MSSFTGARGVGVAFDCFKSTVVSVGDGNTAVGEGEDDNVTTFDVITGPVFGVGGVVLSAGPECKSEGTWGGWALEEWCFWYVEALKSQLDNAADKRSAPCVTVIGLVWLVVISIEELFDEWSFVRTEGFLVPTDHGKGDECELVG